MRTAPPTLPSPLAAAAVETRRPPGAVDRVALAIATGFGAGYVPVAPGTAGTVVGAGLFLVLARWPAWLQLLATAGFTGLAIWAAGRAGSRFGCSDDQRIVSDEIAGYLVTMALAPATPLAMAAGFVLFRLFDELKPWPASHFDRHVNGGLGNVLDDVFAGLYARAGVALVLWLASTGGR